MLNEILNNLKDEKPVLLPNALNGIFSWNELVNALNLRPFVSASRMKTLKDIPYSWQNQAWLSDINTFPPSLLDKVVKENVCVLIDSSRVSFNLNEICNQLEEHFKLGAADAHIFFTLSENIDQGYGIHWDPSHNLIVQVEGTSTIKIWDEWSVRNRAVESLEKAPVIDTVLNPGDVAFVPKNYYYKHSITSKAMTICFPVIFNEECGKQERYWIKL